MSPSKEPKTMTLEEFAELEDAPEGKGGQQRKINWDNVLKVIRKKPMSNATVFGMIIGNKEQFMFSADAKDPNPGTVWTQLKKWVTNGLLAKRVDDSGNIFYGPIVE